MTVIQAKVAWRHDSGLPEDAATNTFHFDVPVPTGGTDSAIRDALHDFFTDTYGGDQVNNHFSSVLTGIGDLKLYDLSDPSPRVPRFVGTIGASGATSGTALPSEVAVKLSLRKVASSGENPARRRGGIFLGPLSQNCLASSTNPRVHADVRNVLVAAAEALIAANDVTRTWVIWSPTDAAAYEIEAGWVDDAFDTIRSRGERALVRTEFP